VKSGIDLLKKSIKKIDLLVFEPPKRDIISRILTVTFVLILFLIGVVHWVSFFNRGDICFKAEDWALEVMHYSVLQDAVKDNIIPYHVSRFLFFPTYRFLAHPDISLSPQIFLLKFLSIANFFLAYVLTLYAVGFVGCLLIKRRYKLSIFSFSILYFLFNFNGHLTSHIAVGHVSWLGYFLLPFFCLLLFELIEGNNPTEIAIKLSFVLFFILLQGSLHIFVWCIMFMIVLAAFNLRYIKPVLIVCILSLFLSLYRFFPAVITFWKIKNPFQTGYPNISVLIDSFINIHDHSYRWVGSIIQTLGWWEYDFYVGLFGFALIVYFGIYLRFSKDAEFAGLKYKEFDMPILLMSIFSLNYLYFFINRLPIPFINSERVSSRLLLIPVLMLIIISCIRLQKWIYHLNRHVVLKVIAIFGVVQMAFALALHSRTWFISGLENCSGNFSVTTNISIVSKNDPLYTTGLNISMLISLLAILSLSLYYFLFRRKG